MARNEEMASQITKLKQKLEEAEQNVKLSAEIGNTLLQQNNDLETRCEQLSQDYSQRIEALEQEKYTLQMRLSTKENMEKTRQNDLENQREQLAKEAEQERERQQMKHTRAVQQLQAKVEAQQADLEMAGMTEEQLKETISKQEEMLKSAHEKLRTLECVMPVDNSEELLALQRSSNVLKSEKDFLQIELKESQDKLQQLTFLVESKDQRVENLTKEVEEERHQATSYYNALEKCREEVMDLQVQLDIAKMDSMDHKRKGNSLFAEVEDRRKELEAKMISLKVQFDAAKEQLAIKKQQNHKLKFQIAGLLQMSGGRVDAAQIERLEQALAQRDGEIQILNSKVAKLERNQNAGSDKQLDDFCQKLTEQPNQGGHQVDLAFIDLLKAKLKEANDKIEKLTKELQTERMLVMAGSDNLIQAERRLYLSESEADSLRASNLKLNLKLEELRTKLKIPDPNASRQKPQEYYIEKIPLPTDKKEGEPMAAEAASTSATATTAMATATATATAATTTAAVTSKDTASPQNSLAQDADHVFDNPPAMDRLSVHDVGLENSTYPEPSAPLASGGSGEVGPDPVIPPLKRLSKKSVSMCETVSMLDDRGQVQETANLKTGNEKSGVLKRRTEGNPDEESENAEPNQGGGRRRPQGRKQHKVIYMGSEPKNECKSQ